MNLGSPSGSPRTNDCAPTRVWRPSRKASTRRLVSTVKRWREGRARRPVCIVHAVEIRITDVIGRTVSARRGAGAAPSRAEAGASVGIDDAGSAAGGF